MESTSINNTLKVVTKKGSKHVNVSSSDNRKWISTMICISINGTFMSHYYIFKEVYLQHDYIKLCELRAIINAQKNGWIKSEFFCD